MLGPRSGPEVSYDFLLRPFARSELFSREPDDALPPKRRPESNYFLLSDVIFVAGPRSRFRCVLLTISWMLIDHLEFWADLLEPGSTADALDDEGILLFSVNAFDCSDCFILYCLFVV